MILPDGVNYNEQEVADGYACVYKYHGHKSRELSQVEFDKLNRLMRQARAKTWAVGKRSAGHGVFVQVI